MVVGIVPGVTFGVIFGIILDGGGKMVVVSVGEG
jgi:hypothetical protein